MLKYIIKSFYYCSALIILLTNSCEKEVSVSPPDEPPPNGMVYVNSYPPGFSIYLDGKNRVRRTPDSLTWLETGEYELILKKEFFIDSTFTVDVVEGERSEIFIDFSKSKRMLGRLEVNSTPEGATIFLGDSNTTRETPYIFDDILPGIYDVSLELSDPRYRGVSYSDTVRSSSSTSSHWWLLDTVTWTEYSSNDYEVLDNDLTCLAIDQNDVAWIGSGNGLIRFDGTRWEHFLPGNSLLTHKVVNAIDIDKENNQKWIATNGGINIADDVTISQEITSQITRFPTDEITSLFIKYTARPEYYFLTQRGLGAYRYDRKVIIQAYTWRFESLPSSNYTEIWADRGGFIIGTNGNGVLYERDWWASFNTNNSGIPGNNISSIYGENRGVWVAHLPIPSNAGGLSFFHGFTFDVFLLEFPSPIIHTIFVDSRNIKWVGTNKGVYAFQLFEDRILIDESNSGLEIKDVIAFDEDSKGHIWIITQNEGVFVLKDIEFYIK